MAFCQPNSVKFRFRNVKELPESVFDRHDFSNCRSGIHGSFSTLKNRPRSRGILSASSSASESIPKTTADDLSESFEMMNLHNHPSKFTFAVSSQAMYFLGRKLTMGKFHWIMARDTERAAAIGTMIKSLLYLFSRMRGRLLEITISFVNVAIMTAIHKK
jgi:predicted RND superfamily exporter protein